MKADNQQDQILTILHFNDAYDIEPDNFGQFGFTNFMGGIQKAREKYTNSLLIFSRDAFAPSKLSKVKKGWQMVHCLNQLKIDVACFGNHQFDYPYQHSLALAKQCSFPWLLANIKLKDKKTNIGEALDYFIIDKGGIKIGFIGLAGPDFLGRLISAYKDKLQYTDPIIEGKKLCQILRSKGCTLIVALTHMRMQPDQAFAKNVPDVDIILGGHDHVVIKKLVNKTPLLKSGKNFEHIGIYQIHKNNQLKSTYQGRRWLFILSCMAVQKTNKKYPELEKYIKQVVSEYNNRGNAKTSTQQKKRKKQLKIIPQNGWKISYSVLNGKTTVQIFSDCFSQICFTRCFAFQKEYYYIGYNSRQKQNICNEGNPIIEAIQFIISRVQRSDRKRSAVIYGPGTYIIPYIVETCDVTYIPGQIEISVLTIKQLQQILNEALKNGIFCYAIINQIKRGEQKVKKRIKVGIKFIRIPGMFIKQLQKLKIQALIEIKIQQKVYIYPNSYIEEQIFKYKPVILFQFPSKLSYRNYFNYFMCMELPIQNKQQFCQKMDNLTEDILADYLNYLGKNLSDFQLKYSQIYKNVQNIQYCGESQKLALKSIKIKQPNLALTNKIIKILSRQYFSLNKIENIKKYVFNQKTLGNPTYQLNYGYTPIIFQDLGQLQQMEIRAEIDEDCYVWVNLQKNYQINVKIQQLFKKLTKQKLNILQNSIKNRRTMQWITKYAKKTYKDMKLIQFEQLVKLFQKLSLL